MEGRLLVGFMKSVRTVSLPRTGTELATFGICTTRFGKDRYDAPKHRVLTGVNESAPRAELECNNVVGVINTSDHGCYELRELLRIPVVFITASSLHLACQLPSSFALIGHNNQIRLQVEELARCYGLASRMISSEILDLTYDNSPKYIEQFGTAARNPNNRGAVSFLVASNPQIMIFVNKGPGIEPMKKGLFAKPDFNDLAKLRNLLKIYIIGPRRYVIRLNYQGLPFWP